MDAYVLSVEQVRDLLLRVCEEVVLSEEILAKADRDIGDGDHGMGMALGFSTAQKILSEKNFADVYEVFSSLGNTLISSMGGASGIIFGMMFYGGSKGKTPQPELTTQDFSTLFSDSLAGIQTMGKAQVGDKTMVDALHPMVESIAAGVEEGIPFKALLLRAHAAATEGMERSKRYIAKFGKAKTLGERALGYPDAGAVSVAIIARAMHQWSEEAL